MSHFGELIKDWRKNRGFSQMELAFESNISSKHISFLETGRSQPSREMIIRLSNSLNIPLNERNILFSAAGFAEAYQRSDINQPEMKAVRDALSIMLNNHLPYPAVVFDWDWNIMMENQSYQQITQFLREQQPDFPDTTNILEILFDYNGARPFIENWDEVASFILQRLHREKIMFQDRRSDRLEKLLEYPDIPKSWQTISFVEQSRPMVNVIINLGQLKLNLFSTLATFGTAIDITMEELMIEQYFPLDEVTKNFFLS
ncbi:helix-turn-helix domain-containing protein [Aliikangiella coralliicola]|nr:helix-turn-helix transcriptional regulator [Aliikangiella coralliicola]